MNTELAAIVIILALAAACAVVYGYRQAFEYRARIAKAEENIDRLTVQVLGLKSKRHTMSTVAGIEDALAVLYDLLVQQEVEERRMKQLHEVLSTLREGPHAYDPERPAGRREPEFSKYRTLK